jgi:hypothetical protein
LGDFLEYSADGEVPKDSSFQLILVLSYFEIAREGLTKKIIIESTGCGEFFSSRINEGGNVMLQNNLESE